MKQPRVVVIMPVYNEARHLPRVLESIAAQRMDFSRAWFVVVDGNSSDGSATIVREWFRQNAVPGTIVVNPYRKISVSLNLGLQYATSADIVVRLDAHSIYGKSYLADIIRALEEAPDDVGCVGGAHVPVAGATFRERVVEALYTNPMGLGGADYRLGEDVREVDNVYLGAWRPGLLSRAGGFNEILEANEDGEMSARIRKMGYRILRVPLPCRFVINRGPIASIRQWHRYGYWRSKMLQRNPAFWRRRHVLSPLSAVAALSIAASPLRILLMPAFAAYAFCVFRARARGENLAVTLATLAFFPALQFAYGMGMIAGLVTGPGSMRRRLPLAGGTAYR